MSVFAGVAKVYPEPCVSISTCDELEDMLVLSARTNTILKVCSSSTPIDCQATKDNDRQLGIIESELGGRKLIAHAQCISTDLEAERCVLDLSPAVGYTGNFVAIFAFLLF